MTDKTTLLESYSRASHDLKAPLTIMKVYVQSTIKKLQEKGMETDAKNLELVDQKIDVMTKMIQETFAAFKDQA